MDNIVKLANLQIKSLYLLSNNKHKKRLLPSGIKIICHCALQKCILGMKGNLLNIVMIKIAFAIMFEKIIKYDP